MQGRYNLAHLILAIVIVLGLTLLMVCVDAQAQIAFVSYRDGNPEIYVMDADGKNQRRLTNHLADDDSPSWSPDGKRIAFVSKAFESDRDGEVHFRDGRPTSEIYVMDVDGGNPQNLTLNPGRDFSPAWSPDGKRIAFSSNREGRFNYEIYVMGADGGNPQRLTNDPHADIQPSWSPDGRRIVFSARRAGHFETKFSITNEIYVMEADGRNQRRLTKNPHDDLSPSWSPDGKRIAFSARRDGHVADKWGLTYEIYVMDADGRNEQRLTENGVYEGQPSWSPDSRRIAFVSDRDGNYEIYVMDADGGNQLNLSNNRHGDYSPAWSHSPFSVSPAGKKVTRWGWLKQVD